MFKKCTMCEKVWADRDGFLSDPDVKIIGYQVNFEDLQLGFFLFNHMVCITTLAIHAAHFVDLHAGPIFSRSKTGTSECNEHCLHKDDLDPCNAECECGYVRDIIQVIRNWPATQDQTAGSSRALSA